MGRRRFKNQPCAYCGGRPGVTKDHIIPKCLLVGPLPQSMPTVPACKPCHDAKAKNDGYLRDLLSFEIDCGKRSTPQKLMEGRIIRAMQRGQSEFARQVVASARRIWVRTPSGLYIDHAYAIPLNGDRINTIFTTIARGIYYKLARARFPDGYRFEVLRVLPRNAGLVFDTLKKAGLHGPYLIGDDFGCLFAYWEKDPGVATWFMWFYEGFFIKVRSKPDSGKMSDDSRGPR